MLKNRDLHEVPVLFELLSHPDVFPYVRQKATTSDEYYFITKQTIEAEENGELISRTILDEYYQPIGTINLFDINENHGFLATWIGQPFLDRKSTRLNSSHVAISYAVFCLKKQILNSSFHFYPLLVYSPQ